MNEFKKVWYIYTTECYSVVKTRKVLIHDATWVIFAHIILCERNQNKRLLRIVSVCTEYLNTYDNCMY